MPSLKAFLTKKRIKNNGTVPQYYVEGDHEAIIPKELFMQVQAELVRRRVVHVSPTGKERSFSCNHCFAQMVFCGDCGELVSFTGVFTGTTTAASPSYGAASAVWNRSRLKRTAPTGR